MKRILLVLINIYRYAISPFIGNHCRYYPSCSEYTLEAILRYGGFYGSWLGLKRILRCHPFHPGGLDPVPDVKKYPFSSHE
ncbi:membrane protein insertion efficiency factor YidD [Candidatus Nitrosacidococcus sp. I8]|uniref:membrane protein insertion efficiency factor YidD n=1 Tax=Candidatus Nitrosacidococcus sp. I8 TaxID=2942908 RepID=UPI00222700C5|nr:membrane protein insertion efficiency factor YidD [Candidatus Nitrosacidococcus sp. I8]